MKIEYTPDDRYDVYTMPIKDCTNQVHVHIYLTNAGFGRLIALQVMRDTGLLPDVHRQLANLRREWHAMESEVARLRTLACENYAEWWEQYKAAKLRRSYVKQRAELIYNRMFLDVRWKSLHGQGRRINA